MSRYVKLKPLSKKAQELLQMIQRGEQITPQYYGAAQDLENKKIMMYDKLTRTITIDCLEACRYQISPEQKNLAILVNDDGSIATSHSAPDNIKLSYCCAAH